MKRLLAPLMILVVCALGMRWWSGRDQSPLARFARGTWSQVRLSNKALGPSGMVLQAADPVSVTKLVNFIVGGPGDWRERPFTPLFIGQIEFLGPGAARMHFRLAPEGSGCWLHCEDFYPGSRWRLLSSQQDLYRMFPRHSGSIVSAAGDDIEVPDLTQPICATWLRPFDFDPADYATHRSKRGLEYEFQQRGFRNVLTKPVDVRKGLTGVSVHYDRENLLSKLAIQSGDIVLTVNGRSVCSREAVIAEILAGGLKPELLILRNEKILSHVIRFMP